MQERDKHGWSVIPIAMPEPPSIDEQLKVAQAHREAWNQVNYSTSWCMLTEDDARSMLSVARSYVQESYRDAHVVYQDDGQGQPSYAAIGIAPDFYDKYGVLSRKQHAMQLITEWQMFGKEPYFFRTEARLWCEAMLWVRHALARRGKVAPDVDFLTQKQLKRMVTH